MNKNLFYVVVVAVIGGFLFGFDSGVISGCEKAIQSEFALSAFWHGLIVSGALIGTVIGVFTAGRPSDKWGRKPTVQAFTWTEGANKDVLKRIWDLGFDNFATDDPLVLFELIKELK